MNHLDHIVIAAQDLRQGADYLRDDVARCFLAIETASSNKADRDCWIQVTTRDVTNGVRHRKYGETKGQRNAEQANANIRKRRGENSAAATAEHEPKGTGKFCEVFLIHYFPPVERIECTPIPSHGCAHSEISCTSGKI